MSARRMTVGTIGWIVGMAFAGIASAQAPPALLPEAESVRIDKNKFVSFSFPDAIEGTEWAVRVKLVKLYNTDPADTENEACPPRPPELPDLSAFNAQVRWAGPPELFPGSNSPHFKFLASLTQCCPEFRDWNAELDPLWEQGCITTVVTSRCEFGNSPCLQVAECPQDPILHLYGAVMVPCSEYEVQLVDVSCLDLQDEGCYSEALTLHTAQWADVTLPSGGRGQPNFTDIGYEVDAFRAITAIRRVQAFLRKNVAQVDPEGALINFTDIGLAVGGFQSIHYPEEGPSDCLEQCE